MSSILSDIYLKELLKKITSEYNFEACELSLISKSEKLQTQILNLYKKFYTFNINPQKLYEIITEINLDAENKKRVFDIVIIYKKFMNFLAEKDFSIQKLEIKKQVKINNISEYTKNLIQQAKSTKYLEFDDSLNEITYIADKIKEIGDFDKIGIYLSSKHLAKTLCEIFNSLDIPTNLSFGDEKNINFRIKYAQILNFLEIITINKEDNLELLKNNIQYSEDIINELINLNNLQNYEAILNKIAELEQFDDKKTINSIVNYINFSKNILLIEPSKDAILKILDNNLLKIETNCINKVKISFNLNEKFEYLFIPFLIENNFSVSPETEFIDTNIENKINCKIQEIYPEFVIENNNTSEFKFEFINNVFSMGEHIILSCSNYSNAKSTTPSVVFEIFKYIDNLNYKKIENAKEEKFLDIANTKSKKISSKIFQKDENIVLSASSIRDFLTCPKKYFYKNILNIKEKSNFFASYGSCVHAVFEVFNNRFTNSYNKKTLIDITNILFNTKIDTEKAKNIGFSDFIIDVVLNTDDLSLFQMKEKLLNAIEQIEKQKFFENPPKEQKCEIPFKFNFPNIPNVEFRGRIDLVAKFNDKYSVVDYKTITTVKKLQSYYTDFNTVKFLKNIKGELVYDESLEKGYDYQLPIYYFATQMADNLSDIKDEIYSFYLQFIRPEEDGGVLKDEVLKKDYEEVAEYILNNIDNTIVSKIRAKENFEINKGYFCSNCSYSTLCNLDEEEE